MEGQNAEEKSNALFCICITDQFKRQANLSLVCEYVPVLLLLAPTSFLFEPFLLFSLFFLIQMIRTAALLIPAGLLVVLRHYPTSYCSSLSADFSPELWVSFNSCVAGRNSAGELLYISCAGVASVGSISACLVVTKGTEPLSRK